MPDRAAAPAAPATLSLQLAGVPRLVLDRRELNPGTRKALALALMVALEPGLRRSRAADLLWPDTDPAAARRNVRRDLFRLRQIGLALGDGSSAAGSGASGASGASAEVLSLDGTAIDWPAPGALPPRWLDGLDEVAGAEFSHWVVEQRALLQRRWLQALEAQARACERDGDISAALHAWRGLLADTAAGPGHAEARAALARLQPEAPDLVASDRADAASGAAPAAGPAGSAAATRAARFPFVGRVAELQAIRAALAAGRAVLIDGSPGIGKTRTALEALADHDGVLLLRCRPEDQAVPYAGALRGLRALREAAPDVTLPAWVRRDLALLVPEWGPAAASADPERLARAYRAALVALAAGNFGACVVDDWQWADEPSQALWQPTPPLPLPWVLVHRSGELPPASFERRRGWIERGWVQALRLAPLDEADARALLAHALPAQAPSAPSALAPPSPGGTALDTAALLARGAGNPLFLLETLRHARDRGDALMPASVQETIVARARALGPAVRRVLEAASLIGDDTGADLLAGALGLDELAVVQALEHAQAAELVTSDARGRVRPAHDLIGQAIAESLSPLRRAALHGQLAAALERAGAEPGRIARHLDAAQRPADAAGWHLRAAGVASRRHAWREADNACAAALAAAADPALRLEARLLAAQMQRRLADPDRAQASLQAALPDAVQLGPSRVVELELRRAELLSHTGRAEQALARLGNLEADPALLPEQRQRLLIEQANAWSYLGRHAQSLPVLERALAELPASALAERLHLRTLLGRNLYWAGRLDEVLASNTELLTLARALGDELALARGLFRQGVHERELGQIDSACANLQRSIELCRSSGYVEQLRSALTTLATVRLDRLQLDEAQALLDECAAAAPYWDTPDLEDVYDERLYRLHHLRGEVEAAWAVTERSLERNRRGSNHHSHLSALMQAAGLALATGDVARARRHLDDAVELHAAAAADSLAGRELETHTIELLQAEGRAAEALRRADAWLAAETPRRVADQARVLIAAAQAALDREQPERAAAHLAALAALPLLSAQQQALGLRARVRLARSAGSGPNAQAAAADAERWLGQPVLPALEAAALRRALAASSSHAG